MQTEQMMTTAWEGLLKSTCSVVFPALYLHNVDQPCQIKITAKKNVRMQLTAIFIIVKYIILATVCEWLKFSSPIKGIYAEGVKN